MIRRFLRDIRGNYAMMTVLAAIPIMGGLALAVDYSQMTRQRQDTLNALDAANIATATRYLAGGATTAQIKAYAKDFFEANLASVDPVDTKLTIVLPDQATGGGTIKMTADLKYKPYFFPAFAALLKQPKKDFDFAASSEVRLKNTLEVALVLDNSGSMDYTGTGSGKKRMVLLKEAAKQLVDTIALQGDALKQVSKPIQFALVPFAASVNVGAGNKDADWMDKQGLSPIHHENFDWATSFPGGNKYTQVVAGVTFARGSDWGSLKDKALTRFTLYDNTKVVTAEGQVKVGQTCTRYNSRGVCTRWQDVYEMQPTAWAPLQAWDGCVEARPYPYNVNDDTPDASSDGVATITGTPAKMFVPMFAPDEAGERWKTSIITSLTSYSAANNWWNDGPNGSGTAANRTKNMTKYFEARPLGTSSTSGVGPNYSCTTKAITPLTDVTVTAGKDKVKNAIDAMAAEGATNVPEGMAWGWRVLSSTAPFSEGRAETERGNDKVVIVLTDGANTYYTPGSLGYSDSADLRTTYSSYGYARQPGKGSSSSTRLFLGTSGTFNKTDFSNANYTKALNEQFDSLCNNAKNAGVLVLTVSLDLDASDKTEKAQMDALESCASGSRFRKDASGNPAKLYFNANGGNLADKFREIADELSNLRIVG